MPGELEKICEMLEDGRAELQCAAAMVLGELQPKDAVVRKALVKALKVPNDSVRLYAIEALSRIDAKEALPHLVPLLSAADPVKGRVIQILTTLGSDAAKALRDHLSKADAHGRKSVLEALGHLKEVDTAETLFAGLLDGDLEVVKQAAQSYRQRVEAMPPEEKRKALKEILEFMDSPRVRKQKTPLASCLRIVGAIGEGSAAKQVLAYVDRKQPPAVRSQALFTLGRLPLDPAFAKAAVSKLLPLLEEDEFNEIVKPALDVLWKIPVPRDQTDRVFKLLKSAHPQVRLYGVKGLGSIGSSAAAEALIEALGSEDNRIAEMAGAALRSNPDFAPLLVKVLGREKDLPRAWKIANILRTYRNVLDKKTVRGFLAKCLALADRKEGGFQIYFEIVRAAAPELLREAILKKGRALLASRKADDAERLLRLLERDDLASPESDLALALARLQGQRRDLAHAGKDRGPALFLFSKLLRREDFPLVKSIEKEKLFGAEDLLYLGFALIERQGVERDAGAEILKRAAKKFGSRNEGKIARQKLKTQGIG